MATITENIKISFNNLLKTYEIYIKNSYIDNNYVDFNFSILNAHIEEFDEFINIHEAAESSNIIFIYFKGILMYCKRQYSNMIALFENATPNGHILTLMGYYFYIVEKNYSLMKIYLYTAIEENHNTTIAMVKLAQSFEQIENNIPAALEYYDNIIKITSDMTNHDILNIHGVYHLLMKDYTTSLNYYTKSANMNSPQGIYGVALCKYYIDDDINTKIKILLIACEYNFIPAVNHMAWIYKDANNYAHMLSHLIKSLGIENNKDGFYGIAYYYDTFEKNFPLALKYYQQAIDMNCDKSMFRLGEYYRAKGDNSIMKKYYNMAAELNNVDALYSLARHYELYEQDYKKMKAYYQKAIILGHIMSMHNLAYYYESVEHDYIQMKKNYELAISLGHSMSMFQLGMYYETIEHDYKKMIHYYESAISLGHPLAMYRLAVYYFGIEDNKSILGNKYYNMAIENGYKVNS